MYREKLGKRTNKMSKFFALFSAVALFSSFSIWGQEAHKNSDNSTTRNEQKEESMNIAAQRDAKNNENVDLFLIFPDSEHRAQLSESTLKKWGCQFATKDQRQIVEM